MVLGLIADTHGYFDPQILERFAGVHHILHAGDIGGQSIIDELTAIAPVTAVLGNNDFEPNFRETELVEFQGCRCLVHHIVGRPHPSSSFLERVARSQADVIVFGHTHERYVDWDGDRLWVNPGYAGRPRSSMVRSVALLEVTEAGPKVRFLTL